MVIICIGLLDNEPLGDSNSTVSLLRVRVSKWRARKDSNLWPQTPWG